MDNKFESILIRNFEEFTCEICFLKCVIRTIECCEQVDVKCPSNCTKSILDGEIRALLSKEELEKYHAKSIQVAEMKISNSFHCRTVNCIGWCELETDVEQFRCPVCNIVNCIKCGAIHKNISCYQYQSKVDQDTKNLNINLSEVNISKEIDQKLAMKCPKCQAVISKVAGCDFIKCSYCETGICWATKGPRWGPKGIGDTSGGCACQVKRCSPNCRNCH